MSTTENDTSYWVLEEDSPLVVLPALWRRAPNGAFLAFEGIHTRDVLSRLLRSTESGFEVFLDSKRDGTELYETRPSPEEIAKLIESIRCNSPCDSFYHFKIIDGEGRIWAWHHDACSGGHPYLNPRIDEATVVEIARELRCAHRLEKSGLWGWDHALEKKANQPLQRNASTGSVSNFESPARRG